MDKTPREMACPPGLPARQGCNGFSVSRTPGPGAQRLRSALGRGGQSVESSPREATYSPGRLGNREGKGGAAIIAIKRTVIQAVSFFFLMVKRVPRGLHPFQPRSRTPRTQHASGLRLSHRRSGGSQCTPHAGPQTQRHVARGSLWREATCAGKNSVVRSWVAFRIGPGCHQSNAKERLGGLPRAAVGRIGRPPAHGQSIADSRHR
jgi:hypothetical protein